MPADKFLSYSKFNKKYFNPYYLDPYLISFGPVTYYLSQNSLQILKDQYQTPNANHQSHSGYLTTFIHAQTSMLTAEQKTSASNMYNEFMQNHRSSYDYRIYPFDINQFVTQYYPNTLPSEKNFIIRYMLEYNKIIDCGSYLVLSFHPFTKDEYNKIKEYWVENHSISSIINNLKQVQSILDSHKKDLRHLLAANDELLIENKELKRINQDLNNQLYRSTFTNWS